MKWKYNWEYIKTFHGKEADVKLYTMTDFPGIGGTIEISQTIEAATRTERNAKSEDGFKQFLKHLIIKKMDDYFLRTHRYTCAHITRPLGSLDKGYIYEWTHANVKPSYRPDRHENFPWCIENEKIKLDEWDSFVRSFTDAGMYVDHETTNDKDESENIIHQFNHGIINDPLPRYNRKWVRIDLGSKSLPVDYDKFISYLKTNEDDIKNELDSERGNRYNMIYLAAIYLRNGSIDEMNMGRIEVSTYSFRFSSLSHLDVRGVGKEG